MNKRRHDIDWLRVVAIGLLIIYHSAIGFQDWGALIGFIKNAESLNWIWYPMSMLNMWRIPILFFVSGMGVYFSMRKRNLLQVFLERSQRILIPFLFGMLAIVPLHIFIWQKYYYQDLSYHIGQSHLWFLQNILVYTVTLSPLVLVLKKINKHNWIRKHAYQAVVFIITAVLFIIEAQLIQPEVYTLYAFTGHGYLMGFIAFAMGFYMISLGKSFWEDFKAWKWVYLFISVGLYSIRILYFDMEATFILMSIESTAWIFTVFGFFHDFFNKETKSLNYLKKAAYPIYIIHMVVQYGISAFLFPLAISTNIKFILLCVLTLAISLLIYEFIIRRISILSFLLGADKCKLNIKKIKES